MNVREKLVELIKDGIRKGLRAKGDDRLDYSFEDVADHLISNGVTVQEWVPVTKRLPQEDGAYLVTIVTINSFNEYKYIDIRSFAKDGEMVNEYELAGQKNVWYYHDSEWGYISTDSVTHWMPLPQPPKGE